MAAASAAGAKSPATAHGGIAAAASANEGVCGNPAAETGGKRAISGMSGGIGGEERKAWRRGA
jgi:hypothetical protein